jgi:hypothetical protein
LLPISLQIPKQTLGSLNTRTLKFPILFNNPNSVPCKFFYYKSWFQTIFQK